MRAEALEPLLRRLGRLVKNEQVILTILAALIGVAGGACAIAFREILDLAQVTGYFCYANRFVLRLGAELEPLEAGQDAGGGRGGG